jgi:hypothetical protein
MAGSAALAGSAGTLAGSLRAHAQRLSRDNKACILLWMGGGPPTIDIWDLKPGTATGGPFRAISTSADVEVCEHLTQLAGRMDHLSLVRSMSTREADHERGRYYMHTGYEPNPSMVHPSYGAVIAHELESSLPELEIPPFVSIGGPSEGPGFLGMAYAPFQVDPDGQIRNLPYGGIDWQRMADRMTVLAALERRFIAERRGGAAEDHAKVLAKTQLLLTSQKLEAFQVDREPPNIRQRYGNTGFARGCLMARRLVETGVPFVEVNFGGWDLHENCFTTLQNKLPEMDRAMSALLEDLVQRGLWQNVVVLWMGEFGRTPRINGNAGRDHFARAWTVAIGGGRLKSGVIVGKTNREGTGLESEPYTSQDLMATVCYGLGISLETTFTAKNGRPMRIANSGKLIQELVV